MDDEIVLLVDDIEATEQVRVTEEGQKLGPRLDCPPGVRGDVLLQ